MDNGYELLYIGCDSCFIKAFNLKNKVKNSMKFVNDKEKCLECKKIVRCRPDGTVIREKFL